MPAPTLVFDIETIPDAQGLRRLGFGEADESDTVVVQRAREARLASHNTDFLPLHLQRVVAIAAVFAEGTDHSNPDKFKVISLGDPADDEAKLIRLFFRTIEKYTPQLVSWNGGGFDLPVLHYRALIHGISAPRYWEQGDDDRDFKYNNYISRYHQRHCDLMDLMSMYQARAAVKLDELARLCGFPGKLGMDGSQVWDAYSQGRLPEIRAYCETDVVNTYLVWCRFQLQRGVFLPEQLEAALLQVKTHLQALPGAHWQEFLREWASEDEGFKPRPLI